jgi:membrane associated rhomboid family serine protease
VSAADEAPFETLRVVRRRAFADEWALVLAAEGIPARVRGGPEGFVLEVPAPARAAAESALEAFARENVPRPVPPAPPVLDRAAARHALACAALLLAGYAVTGPEGGAVAEQARAEAAAIRAGEWWRALTALGLHADGGHVLGNAIAGALFAFAVFQAFGLGVGALLAVASGTLGNAANALFRAHAHATIGASTAVFGALGLLVGRAMLDRRGSAGRRTLWIPLAAGLALLAMLGTEGERVDLWAHAFGLAAGVLLGAAAGAIPPARLAPAPLQHGALALAVLAVAASWWRALAP